MKKTTPALKKRKAAKQKKSAAQEAIDTIMMLVFNVNSGYVAGTPGMSKVYWAPTNAISAQPEPTTTYGAAGATASTTGSWTFAAEGGFTTNGFIDMKNDLLNGAELEFGNEGDLASPAPQTKLTGRIIELNPEIVERLRDMAGVPGVFMVKTQECASTEYWVVGCACAPAYMKYSFKSDKLGGTAGKRSEFEIMAHCTAYKWSGTITLKAV